MAQDYYTVLGVSYEASSSEIRESYKKLALLHHPDKSPLDQREDAEAKFKIISEAYETLCNDESRMLYDAQNQYGSFDWQDFYEDKNSGTKAKASNSDEDYRMDVNISLEDVYKGKIVKLTIFRNIICRKCKGKGCKTGAKLHKCGNCQGKRQVKKRKYNGFIYYTEWTDCAVCKGAGAKYKTEHLCSRCNGTKLQEIQVLVESYIPRGVRSGYEIVIPEVGDENITKKISSDVILVVQVDLEHPVFKRQGLDLYTTVELPLAEALTGCTKNLVTQLDGRPLSFTIPRGKIIKPGDILKVSGEGLVNESDGKKGDMYVEVQVVFPEKIETHIIDRLATVFNSKSQTPSPAATNASSSTSTNSKDKEKEKSKQSSKQVAFKVISEDDLPPIDETANYDQIPPYTDQEENIFANFQFNFV